MDSELTSTIEIKAVTGLVDDARHHIVHWVDESDASVPFKSPAIVSWNGDDMSNPLTHLDRQSTELRGHRVDCDT